MNLGRNDMGREDHLNQGRRRPHDSDQYRESEQDVLVAVRMPPAWSQELVPVAISDTGELQVL